MRNIHCDTTALVDITHSHSALMLAANLYSDTWGAWLIHGYWRLVQTGYPSGWCSGYLTLDLSGRLARKFFVSTRRVSETPRIPRSRIEVNGMMAIGLPQTTVFMP